MLSVTLSVDFGPAGVTFGIHVCGFVPGAKVDITFGGIVLRSVTFAPEAQGQALGDAPRRRSTG